MNYPVWELEFGIGLLIAVVSVLHVFISHFAIGGGFFLVITEHYAYRTRDTGLRDYLKKHSKFFALVTLVSGAISGVGIWFTIGLGSPSATSALIRIFVWGWAIEWVFFFVEITAAILYYTSWERVPRKTHLAFGWIYFVTAFLSLVVINGILTFMLTLGAWIETRNFWDGFFNPSYLPSLVTRTAFCIALAGIFAFLTAQAVRTRETRIRLIRYAGAWGLTGTVLAVPGLWWYLYSFPTGGEILLTGGLPTATTAATVLAWAGIGLAALMLFPVILPRFFGMELSVLTALVAMTVFGAGEWIRESARKPYIITDYIYGNGITAKEYETIKDEGGILRSAVWIMNREQREDALAGREVFRTACRSCHTINGYRGLSEPLAGLDEEYIFELTARLEHLRGAMPPFPGTETEQRALAVYLDEQATPAVSLQSGEELFKRRCGICHTVRGDFRPLYSSMEELSEEDIRVLISSIGDLTEIMPSWTGTEEETDLLTRYISSWRENETEMHEEGQ